MNAPRYNRARRWVVVVDHPTQRVKQTGWFTEDGAARAIARHREVCALARVNPDACVGFTIESTGPIRKKHRAGRSDRPYRQGGES